MNCQLFILVFLIVVRIWPRSVTQNFSKSAWEKGCTFINVFILFTNAAALVKVCFYLILRILLLMEKLSHKLGKCSITDLTKIDLVLCLVTTGKWGPVNTQSKVMVHQLKGDQGISRFKKKKWLYKTMSCEDLVTRYLKSIWKLSLTLLCFVSDTTYKTSAVGGTECCVLLWEVQVACVLLKRYFWTGTSHAHEKEGK